MDFIIQLNEGVAPFYLGDTIEKYTAIYPYEKEEEVGGWDTYLFFDDTIEVYVDSESGKIETICCRENCFLNRQNLIDMDFDYFLSGEFVDEPYVDDEEIELSGETQCVYCFENAGLQIWVNQMNKIVSVFIADYTED